MAKSKEELIYDIENELVDPTTNKVTGERVKARLLDMVDAMGEGGGGGASQMEYWALPSGMTELGEMALICPIAKFVADEGVVIAAAAYAAVAPEIKALAFGLDPSIKYVLDGQTAVTVYEIFSKDTLLGLGYVKIEESDFYSF